MTIGTFIGQPTVGHERPPNSSADYIFEGVLPSTGLTFVLGAPKLGKSLFVIWLAACLATGNRLFEISSDQSERFGEGFASPHEIGAVLYLTAEDAHIFPKRAEAALRHLQLDGKALEEAVSEVRLPIICLPVSGLRGSSNISQIEKTIIEQQTALKEMGYPIRIIVFDTLTAAFDISDENNNSDMQNLMSALRAYGRQFHCLVIAIAHPNKNGWRSTGQVRGAGSMTASADVILELSKTTGRGNANRRTIKIASQRDGACTGEAFDFEIGTFAGTAAIYPASQNAKSLPGEHKAKGKLTTPQIELLQNMEAWSETDGVVIENRKGHLVNGISLGRMVQRQIEIKLTNDKPKTGVETKLLKDRTRKQVGRDGLYRLADFGLLERYEDNGKPCFRPNTTWNEMTDLVRALSSGAEYKSAATLQHDRINELFPRPEGEEIAMSLSVFLALGQAAIRISPPCLGDYQTCQL